MRQEISFTEEAEGDLVRLSGRDPQLVASALSVIKKVATGQLTPRRLQSFSKTGDLSDCFKVYFGVGGDDDTHRVVFRQVGGRLDVLEVVVVEDRTGDLPYLLAGLRLGRIEGIVRAADTRRRVARTQADLDPDRDET